MAAGGDDHAKGSSEENEIQHPSGGYRGPWGNRRNDSQPDENDARGRGEDSGLEPAEKRSDQDGRIKRRGYGVSPTKQLIDSGKHCDTGEHPPPSTPQNCPRTPGQVRG